ncbi:site-specific integrase [Komagataeibacter melaceti]|uniref:Site-specific integrase n=1 Tax=Komagataeibacter melaceti TaxID=2766577 RepID=A0A371Z0U4_9PROT|nr:site-specific integrase [Komagataeibacter melaceti]
MSESSPRTYSLAVRNGYFYAQWWDPQKGKRRVSLGTKDRATAKRALGQLMAGLASPEPPARPSIDRIMQGYLEDRRPRVASFASLEHASSAICEHLGYLQPDNLTTQVCRAYAKTRHEQGRRGLPPGQWRPLSDGTIIKELVTLRTALRWAVREKWIDSAPAIEVPRAPKSRERWLTHQEANRLIAVTTTPHVRLFILLALYTGARSGAIFELQWDQVNLEQRIISFGQGTGNKGRSIVPMVPQLYEALIQAAEGRTTDWVIEYRGQRIHKIKTAFNKRAAKAGLDDVTPHTLRHTCATWMVMAGVPFEMVAKFLGNSVEMIERVYGHHSPDWLKKATDALSVFSGPRGPDNTEMRNNKV